MCMCNFACKGHPRNDLYCVGWDVKHYSLTRVKFNGGRTEELTIGLEHLENKIASPAVAENTAQLYYFTMLLPDGVTR